MNNITKEGIEVRVGQVWEDLDCRTNGRTCKVLEITDGKAKMARCLPDGARVSKLTTRVSISRMHKSSLGWKLIKEARA